MSGRGRVLFIDASAGAGGDMILGALVDLKVPLIRIREAIRALPLEGWTIRSSRVTVQGIAARKIRIGAPEPGGRGRGWKAISRIIRAGRLAPAVETRALLIFRRLLEAEAEVHGKAPDEVHLHEAGAVDAIIDIVGACVGLDRLAPDEIVVSPMTTGFGSVACRHGTYPVPAPATLLLARGTPLDSGNAEGERLTPTGAAILTTVVDRWGQMPAMEPLSVGHGAGDREFADRPNVLRMVLGRMPRAAGSTRTGVAVLECTIDDATPEVLAYAAERLMASGALEVFTAPVIMKKGRPGHHLTVVGPPSARQALAEIVLRETTTLGLRHRLEDRIEMERGHTPVRTPHGTVRVKTARMDGREVQASPEYEDCARAARRHGVPLREVQQAALSAHRASASGGGSRRRRKSR